MRKIGIALTAVGAVWAFLLVSTDDFYTMELHQFHPFDWKGLLIAGILIGAGLLLRWIADTFYIDVRIGRKHHKTKRARRY